MNYVARIQQLEEEVRRQQREGMQAAAANQGLVHEVARLRGKTGPAEPQPAEEEEEDEDEEDEDSELDEPNDSSLPEPTLDGWTYVCDDILCGHEVVDGFCFRCRKGYRWSKGRAAKVQPYSISTDNEALEADRALAPRGTTPLFDLDPRSIPVPPAWRACEYLALLSRGATRLMCETFNLEFTHKKGIIAWADSTLYEEFAGPKMQKGDFWKIHLGRRVVLDDEDLDGSSFIEDLVEDAVLFPLRLPQDTLKSHKWETIEETPGIWFTRPMDEMNPVVDYEIDDWADHTGIGAEERDAMVPHSFDGGIPGGKTVDDMYDAALERPPSRGPIVDVDYNMDIDDDEDTSPWKSGVFDAVYQFEDDEDNEDGDEDQQMTVKVDYDNEEAKVEGEDVEMNRQCLDSEVGSDYDEDEELSGDEQFWRPKGSLLRDALPIANA